MESGYRVVLIWHGCEWLQAWGQRVEKDIYDEWVVVRGSLSYCCTCSLSGSTNDVNGQYWTHRIIVRRKSGLLVKVHVGPYTLHVPMQDAIDDNDSSRAGLKGHVICILIA